MLIKFGAAALLAVGCLIAAACAFGTLSPARADELGEPRASQQQLQSRIDRLARPADPPTGDQPILNPPPAPGAGGSGSFPRSFVIPGTDTSVRIGGSLDETTHYHLQNGP